MRRRIDTSESLSDCTDKAYCYLDEIDGEVVLRDPPPALYDEELWAELVDAQRRLRAVESRALEALVDEPLDAVEIEIGLKQDRMLHMDTYDVEEWRRLDDALRAHAATLERKP